MDCSQFLIYDEHVPHSISIFRSYDIYISLHLLRLEEDHVDKTQSAVTRVILDMKGRAHVYTSI